MKPGIIVLILGMLFIVGCDGEPKTLVDPPPPTLTADTEDKLIENFEDTYTNMLLADFRNMLHQDFSLILLTQTCSDWGWAPGTTFDRDELILIHQNMFGGMPGTDHEGNGINPLDRIDVSLFERIGEWVTVAETDIDFPGTRRALYEIKLFFHDNTGTHAFLVDNQIIFYADSIDGLWYLKGIRGLQGKANEANSFDSVLCLYR